ncbi:MAG: PAS domain-containing sensor histidine kinase [Opitutaceae bacterium]|nr:PAS domain-containing sensor histidine kinase [Cytophagales bacterium]
MVEPTLASPAIRPDLFQENSEMATLIANFGLSNSSLGPISSWPQCLITTLDIILNSKFSMFLFWGPDHICFYNDAYRPSLGNDGKHPSALGKPGIQVWPEIWGAIKPMIDKVLKGEGAVWSEDQLLPIYRNGKLEDVYWTFSYSSVIDETGNPGGVFVTCAETTQKVYALKKIEESEHRFRQLADELPLFIWLTDFTGFNLLFVNKSLLKYIGHETEKEFLLESWKEIIHKDDFIHLNATYKIAFAKFDPYFAECRFKDKAGNYRWYYIKGVPRFNSDNNFEGYILTGLDIHEKIIHSQQLKDKNDHLTRINNDLDNFVYTASHDLKAPVSNIEGLLTALRNQLKDDNVDLNEDTNYLLNLMNQSINQFKETILDLTEISKVQQIQQENASEIIISNIIEELKLTILDKIKESGAQITYDFSLAKTLIFSKKNIKSVFYNLLSNAVKYRDNKRNLKITIKSSIEHGFTVIEFDDNGLGISEENQQNMFLMFKRFHTHVEGTGIGLYIVKRIMDNSEGRIEVMSKEGKGTTFRLYFKIL